VLRGPDAVLRDRLAEHVGSLRRRRQRGRRTSVYDPEDAIPAAARYLAASGAPDDYHAALFAYNHAEWYVAEVLAKAAEYRGSPGAAGDTPELDSAALSGVLRNPRISLTPIQQADLRSGAIDSRLIATLAWMGRHHSVVMTALKSDHSRYTVDGAVSNHAAGRAMDIGAVDGETCRGTRTGRSLTSCASSLRSVARCARPSSSTAGTPTVRATHAASRAPTIATTSTGVSTDDGYRERTVPAG
jgi:hypothetical protein